MRERKMFLSVEDIAVILDLSVSKTYKIVKSLNEDLKSKKYMPIAGRIPIRYLEDRIYGLEHAEQYLED
ncbi:MAG: hypothetical protein PHC41_16210 [Lachnospiraceae bacterium]|nr:hypothetical protein [Lachnospiraceae bacterium]MDD3617734.1 hypothetical protein [Lachnospiraceae bacterium]NCB94315.1 hypothetical protein [Clostridia bacterium]